MTHDEQLFQRLNQVRFQHLARLRSAMTAAGLHEARPVVAAPYTGTAVIGMGMSPSEGYDIEKVIKAAAALRDALAPFDQPLQAEAT